MAISYYITGREQLYSGLDTRASEQALLEKVGRAFLADVDYVQLREKDLPACRLAVLVEELAALPEKRGSRLLVNERWDIAAACGADGVHLPSDSMPPAILREKSGDEAIVGISCHSESEVAQAARDGASYVLLGPIFPTPSKPGAQPIGLLALKEICGRIPIPVYALGGISAANAEDCILAGAAGVAGIRMFQEASDLEELCRELSLMENPDWRLNG